MENESRSVAGWNAINIALRDLYRDVEPLHWRTIIPSYLGETDPLVVEPSEIRDGKGNPVEVIG